MNQACSWGTLSTQHSHSQGRSGPRLHHLYQQNCWGSRATRGQPGLQGYSFQRLHCLSTATAACGLVHPDPPVAQQFSPTAVVTHSPTCTHCSTPALLWENCSVYTATKVRQQENAEEPVPLTRQLPPQTGRWPSQCPGWTTCRVRSQSETWRGRSVLS